MSRCLYCQSPSEATVYRRHPVDCWEVRLQVCEECLCHRLQVLSEDDIIDERVVPNWGVALVAFAPFELSA
jgi:hypothetical protein